MSEMIPIKSLNGYPLVDTQAREDIAKLKNSGGSGGSGLPATSEGNMFLVTDKTGTPVWTKRTDIKVVLAETVLEAIDEDGDGVPEGGAFYLMNPWETDFVTGGKYEVMFNGTPYECDAVEMIEGVFAYHMLGNLELMGMEGGNPDAPFMMVCVSNAWSEEEMGGVRGMVYTFARETSVTLSITQIGGASASSGDNVFTVYAEIVWDDATTAYTITSCDKTANEALEAIASGKQCRAVVTKPDEGTTFYMTPSSVLQIGDAVAVTFATAYMFDDIKAVASLTLTTNAGNLFKQSTLK